MTSPTDALVKALRQIKNMKTFLHEQGEVLPAGTVFSITDNALAAYEALSEELEERKGQIADLENIIRGLEDEPDELAARDARIKGGKT